MVECDCRQCSQGKAEMLESLEECQKAKCIAKRAVYLAKSQAKQEVPKDPLPGSTDLFYLANQRRCENLDVQGEKHVCNDAWERPHPRSTWAKPRSWYLGRGSMCFRRRAKTPVACNSRTLAQIPFSVVVVLVRSTRNAVVCLDL